MVNERKLSQQKDGFSNTFVNHRYHQQRTLRFLLTALIMACVSSIVCSLKMISRVRYLPQWVDRNQRLQYRHTFLAAKRGASSSVEDFDSQYDPLHHEQQLFGCEGAEYDYHVPVLRDECCELLSAVAGKVIVDCTLGGGGHTKAMLQRGAKVIALDQDPDAVAQSSRLLAEFIAAGQCEIIQTNFRNIHRAISGSTLLKAHIAQQKSTTTTASSTLVVGGSSGDEANEFLVDGILMDLGISSYQIDVPERGFAFATDGPLDMRMSKSNGPLTAAEILNEWSADAIADVLYNYGDETRSRVLARQIVSRRPLLSTADLVDAIGSVTSFKQRSKTLARCFQAVRIVVNDEIAALEEALCAAHRCLLPGGRLAVISYHSLEDRRVKWLFRTGSLPGKATAATQPTEYAQRRGSSTTVSIAGAGKDGQLPAAVTSAAAVDDFNPWRLLQKRAFVPSAEEVARNRRSRSAKLRVAEVVCTFSRNDISNSSDGEEGKKSFPRMGAKQLSKLRQRQQLEQEEQ